MLLLGEASRTATPASSRSQANRRDGLLVISLLLGLGFVALVFTTSGRFEADLVAAFVLTALAVVICLQQGSWLAPPAFFGLFWAVLVWLALGFGGGFAGRTAGA